MKLPRRRFLHLAASAVALPAVSRIARAQAYPTRPVRIIVGFPPAGVGDIAARLIGKWLSDRLGQQFVIENRPGAGGNLATESVANAPPDGYTLLLANSANAIGATFYGKPSYDISRSIAPVASVVHVPLVMEVNPSVPANTVPEFIAYAKDNPGRLNMASNGNGTVSHVAGELFKMMTGVNMVHVPYRGAAPALTDMLGGQVQVMFDNLPSSIEQVRSSRLRALAVTTAARSPALPDIPPVAAFVPGYEVSTWSGIGVPRSTSTEIVERLSKEINAGVTDSRLEARFAELGGTMTGGTPAEFGKLIADETEKWAKVIRAANIKAE
jgi:tripartite-type tricarboxylate transporter receptor subunit TctC